MTKLNKRGFTILELLIATVVFSVVFLGATTAILEIGKLYYKGVVTGRTQETVRNVSDVFSQQLQFNADQLTGPSTVRYTVTNGPLPGGRMEYNAYCIGTTRYTFVINAKVSDGAVPGNAYVPSQNRLNHALWRDTISSSSANTCTPANLSLVNPSTTPAPANGSKGQELLGANMRLAQFDTDCAASKVCTLSISVIYGDNDLMAPDANNPSFCKSAIGNQWCATSQLSTSVIKRVGN